MPNDLYVESLSDALIRTRTSENSQEIIASLDDPESWKDEEIIGSLADFYSGIACLLVFDRHLHPTFWDFVKNNGPDIISQQELLFLFYLEERPFGLQSLNDIIDVSASRSERTEFFQTVRSIFPKPENLKFPGLLFFETSQESEEMLYVYGFSGENIEQQGAFFSSILEVVMVKEEAVDWCTRSAVKLASKGISYERTGTITAKEKIIKLLRTIWKAKSDIATVVSLV
jgi:hypothetical protein